jgi:hypothetical protein
MSDTHQRHTARTGESRADSFHIAGWCTTTGTAVYRNKPDARRAKRRMQSRPDVVDRDSLCTYRCGDHWHIGDRRPA